MSRTIALSQSTALPTVAQVFSLGRKLPVPQRAALIAQLSQSMREEVYATAAQVHAEMQADGIVISEAEIDAEVQAVRAEMYAEGQHQ